MLYEYLTRGSYHQYSGYEKIKDFSQCLDSKKIFLLGNTVQFIVVY